MRFGWLVWWRGEVSSLAGRGPRRLRGPVAALAGVPLLSLGLVAGVSLAAGGAGVAEAASAPGAGAATGRITVTTPAGTATSRAKFTVT
jgi:hypothetical protein